MKFLEPATTFDEQLDKLISRGMVIRDRSTALHQLKHINYYRLSGYWYDFESDHETHDFVSGTAFDEIFNLYMFDKKFRLLLLNAIERVEISLRTQLTYHLSHTYHPHAHLDAALFKPIWNGGPKSHAENVESLRLEVKKSQEPFIRKFDQYEETLPPLWAVCEIMMLGALSRWYANLSKGSDRNAIARIYGMDETTLVSFIHHLSTVRNICAHHARLWNRKFTFQWKLPNKNPIGLSNNFNNSDTRKIYNTLVMLAYLMDVITPGHSWRKRLHHIMATHRIDPATMGFPDGFFDLPIWNRAAT
ncbi:Abi family protein [Candidatus Magnetaquicoccus inordinatus]|uniref:Abi family protein n=1 Tax=Candidatus Magnetaquicoccus inordinatus TaxID=2496818 RepID=UPI00102AD93F|nr:Abi family protein [Candidatus Magnetaquicoccus inordinatus]